MKRDRLLRVNENLKREIGLYLLRMAGEDGSELAAATVTHVQVSSDLHTARVLVSVLADPPRREAVLDALRRRRSEIQADIASRMTLKYTPKLRFELDTSLEQGDRILSLLLDLEQDAATPEQEPEPRSSEDADESL